jgi:hypothetical protein
MRPIFAFAVVLIALPLLAQNSLLDQGRDGARHRRRQALKRVS